MELTHAETDRIEEQLDELLDHAQDLGLLSEAERDRLTDAIAEAPAPEPAIVAALEEWRPKLEEASRASGAVYRYAVLRFDAVVSSPFRRCVETAVMLCRELSVPLVIEPLLGEVLLL